MASYGAWDYRDPSLVDYIEHEHALDVIQRKGGTKQEFKLIELDTTMAAGATMVAAEAGRTNEFDGTGTPIIVYAISSDNTQDKAAGSGALTVRVFGTDENDNYNTEDFTLNGTTEVAGSIKWKRMIGVKILTTGGDGVATGNITITDTGQSEQYLLITAGQAESCGNKMYVPDGWKSSIIGIHSNMVQTADAAAVKLTEGANVWIKKIDGGSVTIDELHQYSITNIALPILHVGAGILEGHDDALWDIFHQSIDTDNTGNVFHYHFTYIVWKEATA